MATFSFLLRLKLEDDADERAIRRAYARELKLIDQEADPAGFQVLREAYERALQWQQFRPKAVLAQAPAEQTVDQPVALPPAADFAQPQEAPAPAPAAAPPPPLLVEQTALPPAAATAARANPETEARAAFSALLLRLEALAERGVFQHRFWAEELKRSLDGAELVNILAREHFEAMVVDYLAQGWRAGHEQFLPAAVEVFHWEHDRQRLQRFGQRGQAVQQATEEMLIAAGAELWERRRGTTLLERLRDPAKPSVTELVRDLPGMLEFTQRFPAWSRTATDMARLQDWQQRATEIPKWRRMITRGPAALATPGAVTAKPSWGKWIGGIWLVFIIFKFIAYALQPHTPTVPPTVPAQVAQEFAKKPDGSKNPELERDIAFYDAMAKLNGLFNTSTFGATGGSTSLEPRQPCHLMMFSKWSAKAASSQGFSYAELWTHLDFRDGVKEVFFVPAHKSSKGDKEYPDALMVKFQQPADAKLLYRKTGEKANGFNQLKDSSMVGIELSGQPRMEEVNAAISLFDAMRKMCRKSS